MCERKDKNMNFFGNPFVNSFSDNTQPCKKPRLDVSFSQVTNCTTTPQKIAEDAEKRPREIQKDHTILTSNDHLWGYGDLDENEVNQCLLEASQALTLDVVIEKNVPNRPISVTPCNQSHTEGSKSISVKKTPPQSMRKTPNKSGTPLFRAASAGNLPDTQVRTSGYASLTCSNGIYNAEGATIHLQSQVKKFREKYKDLEEKLQFKEGEVKNLRIALSRNKSEQTKKDISVSKAIDQLKEEKSKIESKLNKEIKYLTTNLEFKSMEVKSLEEKIKQSRVTTTTNSPRPSTSNSKRSLDFNKSVHFNDKQSNESLHLDIGILSFGVNEGNLLAKLVEPEIYHLSCHDNQVTKEVKHNSSDALSNSLPSLMMLYKCESFSTYSARSYIKKIVKECYKLLQTNLRRMEDEGPPGQLVDRSKELFEKSFTILPLTGKKYSLLNSYHLYPEERGIEMRRMLGLIAVLVNVSSEATEILLGTDFTIDSLGDHHNYNNCEVSNSDKKLTIKPNERDASTQPSSKTVLHVLRDLIFLISSERRTLQYNGVLAGTAIFLTSIVEKQLDISEECQLLLLEIIQHVLTSCPSPAVILYACKFLLAANSYTSIVKRLCVYSVDKAEVEYQRYYTFKKDTCPVTVLCYIVQAMGPTKRYLVTDVMTQWFLGLITKEDKKTLPNWLTICSLNKSGSQKDCACSWNLSKIITTLLCEAALVYYSERSKLCKEEKVTLERLLEKGLILLNRMLQHTSFGLELGYIEGQYELFIHTLSMLEPGIPLHPFQKKIMEDLSIQETQKEAVRRKQLCNDEELNNALFTI